MTSADQVISTILKHDSKTASYKIALLRAINDVVLAYPDLRASGKAVAVPLRLLAQRWIAYYWPFADPHSPILQGPRYRRKSGDITNDISFRPYLTELEQRWGEVVAGTVKPSDGFFLVNDLQVQRRRKGYPAALSDAYSAAVKAVAKAIEMPIRYAGPGNWSIFDKPRPFKDLKQETIPVPGTRKHEKCVVIRADLWAAFRQLSLWIEALCIHEWSLFTERVDQGENPAVDRGTAYELLTDRPDNRRPLSWERNRIDIMLMEGQSFTCPWTEKQIREGINYDLDHLVPLSVYPTNELWNLVPSDPWFNSHRKRARLPSGERLARAQPHLSETYGAYQRESDLFQALREDVALRFSRIELPGESFSEGVAAAVVNLINEIGDARNLARF